MWGFKQAKKPNPDKKRIAYKGRFTPSNCGKGFKIVSDYKIHLEQGLRGCSSAKLDAPINMKQDAIYCWDIVAATSKWFTFQEVIGVVSDKCDNIGVDCIRGLKDLAGISLKTGRVWNGTYRDYPSNGTFKQKIHPDVPIRCELDCKSSTITFRQNDQFIYSINLPKRDAWYPMVHGGFDSYGYVFTFAPITDDSMTEEVKQDSNENVNLKKEIERLTVENQKAAETISRLQNENQQNSNQAIESTKQISMLEVNFA